MRKLVWHYVFIALAATTFPRAVEADTFSYIGSGVCLASPEGFNSKFEPVNSGVAWTTTFESMGKADVNNKITEVGQSIDTASFGVGPRMHMPAAYAYRNSFSFTIVSREDGAASLRAEQSTGSFTAGPYAGVAFTISSFELTRAGGGNDAAIYGSAGLPIVQTVDFANGIKFQRACVVTLSMRR